MNRTNLILLGVLLVQGACIGIQQLGGDEPTEAVARGPLLPDVDADAVTELVIVDGQADSENTVTLRKDGDRWLVTERWNAAADTDKVNELIRELAALEVADVVSTSGLHHVELGVAPNDFTKKVTLGGQTLFLGTSGRGGSTHARVDGTDRVVAVRDFSSWRVNARPDGWVDRTVVEIDPATVKDLQVLKQDGAYSLTREGEGDAVAWLLSDGDELVPIEPAEADTLVKKAAKITATKVLGEYGQVDGQLMQVNVVTDDGTVTYRVGPGEADNTYVLGREDGAHLFEVSSYAVKDLVESSYATLVEFALEEGPVDPEGDAPAE